MSLTPTLSPKSVPSGTQFPGTVQNFLAMVAQYMGVSGLEDFNGVNFGVAEPSPENRDKPWFKITEAGLPVGWYSWNGASWTGIPVSVPFGPTEDRPEDPVTGSKYFDTTINVELTYERGKWRTSAGSPGDVKYVAVKDIETALERNPGWSQYAAAYGRVLGAAGAGNGLTEREYGEKVGEETHALTVDEMPLHTHDSKFAGANADGNDYNADQGLIGTGTPGSGGEKTKQSEAAGEDAPHNNMQPTLFVWCLIKE